MKLTKLSRAAMHTGRDNRTPFVGGTQFPTSQSKALSSKLLNQSKSRAEVGPTPSMTKMDKTNLSTLHGQSVKMPSAIGSLPKVGADMTRVNDPFAAWAEKNAMKLEDNLPSLETRTPVDPLQTEPPGPADQLVETAKKRDDELMRELFAGYPVSKSVI